MLWRFVVQRDSLIQQEKNLQINIKKIIVSCSRSIICVQHFLEVFRRSYIKDLALQSQISSYNVLSSTLFVLYQQQQHAHTEDAAGLTVVPLYSWGTTVVGIVVLITGAGPAAKWGPLIFVSFLLLCYVEAWSDVMNWFWLVLVINIVTKMKKD